MIPHLFYYQLVVWGLLWLCLMLHSPWPSRCATAQQGVADPVPLTFKRTRSNAPTPFAGLPNKPPCLLCEQESAPPKARAPLPPRSAAPDPPPPACHGPLDALLSACHL